MNADVARDTTKVTTRGTIPASAVDYARGKLSHLVARVDGPVLFAEVKLSLAPDPARPRPANAEAVIDVNGQKVRAHVAAFDLTAAVDLLDDRLRRRLDRFAHFRTTRRERNRGVVAREPHEWSHGDPPRHRPEYFQRPPEERELVRRKSFGGAAMTPDEAVDTLDLLGHDFFLFTNLVTGADAVVWYAEGHGLELMDASGRPDASGEATVAPIRISKRVAPRCSVDEAVSELDLDLEPFVFFVDTATDRGAVLYHRYDGHYGLVSVT